MLSAAFSKTKEKMPCFAPGRPGRAFGDVPFCKAFAPAVTAFPMPMLFLFLGAILGSIPVLFKKSGAGKFRPVQLVYFGTGAAIVLGMSCLPETGLDFAAAGGFGFFLLFLAGLLVSVALVLPGISASYMLLLLGLYEITLSAIDRMELLFLSPLILGVLVGILLTTGCWKRHAAVSNCFLPDDRGLCGGLCDRSFSRISVRNPYFHLAP